MSSALLLAWLAAGAAEMPAAVPGPLVIGAVTCPAPAEVAARVQPLLPVAAAERPGTRRRRAVLARDGRDLRVELRGADGALLAERRLGAAPCADLAAAAAVVIATWEIELRDRADAPAAVAAPAPPPAAPRDLALGAALVADLQSGSFAPGLLLEARAGRRDRPLGVALALGVTGGHSLAVAEGSATWRRLALLVGPRWRRPGRTVAVELDAAVAAALLLASGSGFTPDRQAAAFDPGLALGARAGGTGAVAPWVAAGVLLWPVAHQLVAEGSAATRDTPRVELTAAVGVAWRLAP